MVFSSCLAQPCLHADGVDEQYTKAALFHPIQHVLAPRGRVKETNLSCREEIHFLVVEDLLQMQVISIFPLKRFYIFPGSEEDFTTHYRSQVCCLQSIGRAGMLLGESSRRYMVAVKAATHQLPQDARTFSGSPTLFSQDSRFYWWQQATTCMHQKTRQRESARLMKLQKLLYSNNWFNNLADKTLKNGRALHCFCGYLFVFICTTTLACMFSLTTFIITVKPLWTFYYRQSS